MDRAAGWPAFGSGGLDHPSRWLRAHAVLAWSPPWPAHWLPGAMMETVLCGTYEVDAERGLISSSGGPGFGGIVR
jgi:hypothetical protein